MDETYKIYISQEMEEENIVIKLPVYPEEIEIKKDINNQKYTVLQTGEVTKYGDTGLRTFNIKSFFPFASDPDVYISIIEKMIQNKIPVRLLINRTAFKKILNDINILAVIDSFTYTEKGGEPGDIYYTLKFTEYKEYKAKVISSG